MHAFCSHSCLQLTFLLATSAWAPTTQSSQPPKEPIILTINYSFFSHARSKLGKCHFLHNIYLITLIKWAPIKIFSGNFVDNLFTTWLYLTRCGWFWTHNLPLGRQRIFISKFTVYRWFPHICVSYYLLEFIIKDYLVDFQMCCG